MKKLNINSYIAYFLGLALLSFGVILAIKSNYGITVSSSPPYILSLWTDAVSFGTFNYIVQGVVFVLMVVILREFKATYFLSFLTSILLGYSLDFFKFAMKDFNAVGHIARTSCFVISIITISFGLVFFIRSNKSILPFDMFVREVSSKYGVEIGKFKCCFDVCILTIAVVMSFIFFRELRGIHVGTLLSALTIGPTVGYFMKKSEQVFCITG